MEIKDKLKNILEKYNIFLDNDKLEKINNFNNVAKCKTIDFTGF